MMNASSSSSNPQDPTLLDPMEVRSLNNEVNMPPKLLNPAVFPQLNGIARENVPASGPWSFHEHRLFEQACIMYGWGSWKKIQQVIPGRTKDQCKSHAQKFLKNHSNEKNRLIAEHRNMFMMQRCRDGKSKSNNKPSTRSVLRAKKKAVSKNELIPIMTAQTANNKVLKKKRSNENESENLQHTSSFQKERPSSEVGGEGGGSYHNHEEFSSADSIDAICNEIYERKLKSGCKRFPLCLCEKTPCVRDGLLYQFGVRGHQPL